MVEVIKRYLTKPLTTEATKKYEDMRHQGIIPRAIIQSSVSRVTAFTGHNFGAIRAMDETLRSMCDSGFLIEIDKTKLFDQFGVSGKAYRILHLHPSEAG